MATGQSRDLKNRTTEDYMSSRKAGMWKKPKVRRKRIVPAIRFSLKAVFSGF